MSLAVKTSHSFTVCSTAAKSTTQLDLFVEIGPGGPVVSLVVGGQLTDGRVIRSDLVTLPAIGALALMAYVGQIADSAQGKALRPTQPVQLADEELALEFQYRPDAVVLRFRGEKRSIDFLIEEAEIPTLHRVLVQWTAPLTYMIQNMQTGL